MRKILALSILIYLSQGAYALDGVVGSDVSSLRDITSISELVPNLDDLEATATCQGAPACGQFTDIDSCLDESDPRLGCFWSSN